MAAQPPFQPPQGQQQPPAAPAAGQPQQQAPANIAAELWNWVKLASLPLVLFHAFVIFVMPLLVLWMQFHALEIGHGGDKPNAVWWAAVSGLTVVFFATFPILFEIAIGFLAIGEATIPGILRTYFASIGKLLAHMVGLLAVTIFITDLASASWDDIRTAYIAALLIAILNWGVDATDRMKTWWLVLAIDLCAAIIASFILTYVDWHPSGYTGTVFSWLQANKEVVIAFGIVIDLLTWATVKKTSGLGFDIIVWPFKKTLDFLSKMTWRRFLALLVIGIITWFVVIPNVAPQIAVEITELQQKAKERAAADARKRGVEVPFLDTAVVRAIDVSTFPSIPDECGFVANGSYTVTVSGEIRESYTDKRGDPKYNEVTFDADKGWSAPSDSIPKGKRLPYHSVKGGHLEYAVALLLNNKPTDRSVKANGSGCIKPNVNELPTSMVGDEELTNVLSGEITVTFTPKKK